MASLTIRKLDEGVKTYLRLRSAKNGRSVEEEVRVILREMIEGRPFEFSGALSQAIQPPPHAAIRGSNTAGAVDRARVTLIIGGGIAAYKALDLIRRLKERQIQVRCVLTKAAQQFVTPLAASALSHERCYTDLFDPESEFDAGHIRLYLGDVPWIEDDAAKAWYARVKSRPSFRPLLTEALAGVPASSTSLGLDLCTPPPT